MRNLWCRKVLLVFIFEGWGYLCLPTQMSPRYRNKKKKNGPIFLTNRKRDVYPTTVNNNITVTKGNRECENQHSPSKYLRQSRLVSWNNEFPLFYYQLSKFFFETTTNGNKMWKRLSIPVYNSVANVRFSQESRESLNFPERYKNWINRKNSINLHHFVTHCHFTESRLNFRPWCRAKHFRTSPSSFCDFSFVPFAIQPPSFVLCSYFSALTFEHHVVHLAFCHLLLFHY